MTKDADQPSMIALQPDASLSLGQRLASQRKQRGQRVTEVAQQLKVPEGVVQALESDDWSEMGISEQFMRGYARNYAQLMGVSIELDAVDVTSAASSTPLSSVNQLDRHVKYVPMARAKRRWRWLWLSLLSIMVLIALWNQAGLWHDWDLTPLLNDEVKR